MNDIFEIYTDGACSGNPGPGGWSYVFNTDEGWCVKGGHYTETTNNRMELTAVVNACRLIVKLLLDHSIEEAKILTDSSYVYNSIKQNWLAVWQRNSWKNKAGNSVKNKDLWREFIELWKLIDGRAVIVKVAGHAGNNGNELADKHAVFQRDEAIKSRMRRDPGYKPPKSYKPGKGYKDTSVYYERKKKAQEVHDF